MVDIPVGKALVAEKKESINRCFKCCFHGTGGTGCLLVACRDIDRKDRKTVFFKLVDLPQKHKKTEEEDVACYDCKHLIEKDGLDWCSTRDTSVDPYVKEPCSVFEEG